jgi:hypothetical protein
MVSHVREDAERRHLSALMLWPPLPITLKTSGLSHGAALAGGKHSSVHDKHACYMGDCTKSLLDARDVAVSDLHDPLQDADDALTWSARSSRGFNLRS